MLTINWMIYIMCYAAVGKLVCTLGLNTIKSMKNVLIFVLYVSSFFC